MSTRDEVLTIAAAVFLRRGFLGTNTDDITVGMNQAQLEALRMFHSKSQLARDVAIKAFSGYPFVASEDRPGPEYEGLARLVALCRGVAKSAANDPVVQAALRLVKETDVIDADLPKPLVTWFALATDVFEEAKSLGELPPDTDAQAAAWAMVTAFHGVKDACLILGTLDQMPERVELTVRTMLRGLGYDGSDALFN